jgi:hypothetical protein
MVSGLTEKGTINSVPDRTGHGGGKELGPTQTLCAHMNKIKNKN